MVIYQMHVMPSPTWGCGFLTLQKWRFPGTRTSDSAPSSRPLAGCPTDGRAACETQAAAALPPPPPPPTPCSVALCVRFGTCHGGSVCTTERANTTIQGDSSFSLVAVTDGPARHQTCPATAAYSVETAHPVAWLYGAKHSRPWPTAHVPHISHLPYDRIGPEAPAPTPNGQVDPGQRK